MIYNRSVCISNERTMIYPWMSTHAQAPKSRKVEKGILLHTCTIPALAHGAYTHDTTLG